MAAPIKYAVPYECAVHATDISSGKKITNILYFRCGFEAGATYGGPIAGGGDVATVAANVQTAWEAPTGPMGFLHQNYKMSDYTWRAIVGKQYGTPFIPITAVIPGAPTQIVTGVPHGFSTGNSVNITNVTSPTGANGVWVITVLSSTAFTLNGSTTGGTWSGDGAVQKAAGKMAVAYADKYVLTSAAVGAIAGDALPLFASASVRRLNTGVGKSFRSRLSMSPLAEGGAVNGHFDPTTLTAINTRMNNLLQTNYANGGTGTTGSQLMVSYVFSKKLFLPLSPPYTSAAAFTAQVTSASCQPNQGSITRRKPRLSVATA